MDANSSSLQARQLYYVRAVRMTASGEQTLDLVGRPNESYNACRFARLPDPAARKWPRTKL